MHACMHVQSLSRVQLFATPVARQAPLSQDFPSKIYWSRLPFPIPGTLPNPGIESMSPARAGRVFITKPSGKPINHYNPIKFWTVQH